MGKKKSQIRPFKVRVDYEQSCELQRACYDVGIYWERKSLFVRHLPTVMGMDYRSGYLGWYENREAFREQKLREVSYAEIMAELGSPVRSVRSLDSVWEVLLSPEKELFQDVQHQLGQILEKKEPLPKVLVGEYHFLHDLLRRRSLSGLFKHIQAC